MNEKRGIHVETSMRNEQPELGTFMLDTHNPRSLNLDFN